MVGYLDLGRTRGVQVPAVPTACHARRRDHRRNAGRPRPGSPTARYHGGVELVETPELDSGEMVIQAVTGKSLLRPGLELVRHAVQAPAPRPDRRPNGAAAKLTLDTKPRQKISIDGEIAAKTPVTVEVARGAIEVAAAESRSLARRVEPPARLGRPSASSIASLGTGGAASMRLAPAAVEIESDRHRHVGERS